MMDKGWFAEVDPEAPTGYQWRVALQADGLCIPLAGSWFSCEADALTWIRKNVLGVGMLDQPV